MQKEFNPQQSKDTQKNFTDKFKEGPSPKLTPEQEDKLKKESMDIMQKDIEFMRLKHEYTKLQIEGYEHAVLLGQMLPSQVPGLLGLKLMREDLETQAFLSQVKAGIEQGMKEEQKRKEAEQASTTENTDNK